MFGETHTTMGPSSPYVYTNQSARQTEDSPDWTPHGLKNQSTDRGADHCRVIENTTIIPWDHPGNLVSRETEELVYITSGGLLIPLFFLLGTPANVLNMMVFYRQGLKERINFCLFFLALVDILHLTPVFVFRMEQIRGWFGNEVRNDQIFTFMMNHNLIGFYGFGYGSMLLAAIISTERCLCVLFPLTAQRCISTKVFAIVVVLTVSVISLLRFLITAQYQSVCFYEVKTQRTGWQTVSADNAYTSSNRAMLGILDGVLYGLFLSVGSPALVLITTVITAIKLRQIVRWRSHVSSTMSSPKEIGVTKMLICFSTEFLVLAIPVIVVRVTRMFPSIISLGYHINLYRVLNSLYQVSFYVSTFANFLVYYLTGTKYRETLHALLNVHSVHKKTEHSKQTS